MKRLASAFLALGLVAAAPAAAEAAVTAQARDWTRTVEATAEGGYRMGNPNAPLKLVEYASITCPHCAEFAAAASPTLRNDYIRSGRLSWEVRPYLIFPSDPGIFLLMQCEGAGSFFEASDVLFAAQEDWSHRLMHQREQLSTLTTRQLVSAAVRAAGVDQIFRNRGMSDARINSCLADETALQRLVANHRRYASQGVTGTPTFYLNGQALPVGDWAGLQRQLAATPARGAGSGERGR